MSKVEYRVNRRASRRRPPKGSTKIRCYRGPMGLGPNMAVSALDVSETGAAMVVKVEFRPGEELEVNLEGVIHRRPIRKMGTVVWCMPTSDDFFIIGVKFQGSLRYADLNDLARP
ncbi:MAG TPA: PilZ domain-containing protein [Gemmataceae bacterium]|nr:PilZ domain-containing protein [Gemmataceae bacterium]